MKNLNCPFIKISGIVLLLISSIHAQAQNLPQTQHVSIYARDDLQTDGRSINWGNQFEAYNTATDVFYTIANDGDNLYLAVKADKPRIVEKIIAVGITLTINTSGKRNYLPAESRSVTFPVLSVQTGQRIISALRIKTFNIPPVQMPKGNTVYTTAQKDSLTAIANQLFSVNALNIKIKGIIEIPDTLISVYNEQRIRTSAIFYNTGAYIYKLAVPLKLLGISTKKSPKFTYSIKLASRLDEGKKGTMMVYKYTKDGEAYDANQDLDSATDFWGEYTLAKQ